MQGKLDEILDTVGLADRRKHTPRSFQRTAAEVAIARALINEPDIILADEPIGNLDSQTGTEIMMLLQKINKEKENHSAGYSFKGGCRIWQ